MNIGTFLVQLDTAVKAGEIGNLETASNPLGREGLSMVDLYSGFTVLHAPGELLPSLTVAKSECQACIIFLNLTTAKITF